MKKYGSAVLPGSDRKRLYCWEAKLEEMVIASNEEEAAEIIYKNIKSIFQNTDCYPGMIKVKEVTKLSQVPTGWINDDGTPWQKGNATDHGVTEYFDKNGKLNK